MKFRVSSWNVLANLSYYLREPKWWILVTLFPSHGMQSEFNSNNKLLTDWAESVFHTRADQLKKCSFYFRLVYLKPKYSLAIV